MAYIPARFAVQLVVWVPSRWSLHFRGGCLLWRQTDSCGSLCEGEARQSPFIYSIDSNLPSKSKSTKCWSGCGFVGSDQSGTLWNFGRRWRLLASNGWYDPRSSWRGIARTHLHVWIWSSLIRSEHAIVSTFCRIIIVESKDENILCNLLAKTGISNSLSFKVFVSWTLDTIDYCPCGYVCLCFYANFYRFFSSFLGGRKHIDSGRYQFLTW